LLPKHALVAGKDVAALAGKSKKMPRESMNILTFTKESKKNFGL
jgi:hypothetical protein